MHIYALEKQVVSLGLAKQLKELGIKPQRFFRYARPSSGRFTLKDSRTIGNSDVTWGISAFTVAEPGEMLPYRVNSKDATYCLQLKNLDKQWSAAYFPPHPHIGFEEVAATEADAHAKLLMCLVDNKLLTPPEALVGSCLPQLSPS
jgi:hypothetical protein